MSLVICSLFRSAMRRSSRSLRRSKAEHQIFLDGPPQGLSSAAFGVQPTNVAPFMGSQSGRYSLHGRSF
jgi:hypothetical protein